MQSHLFSTIWAPGWYLILSMAIAETIESLRIGQKILNN